MPVHSVDRVCFRFKQMLPEYVWDAGVLEGNPFTYPQVQRFYLGREGTEMIAFLSELLPRS